MGEHNSARVDALTSEPYTGKYLIVCKCGWRVRGRNVTDVSNAAIDHALGRREDHAPLGFSPVVDL